MALCILWFNENSLGLAGNFLINIRESTTVGLTNLTRSVCRGTPEGGVISSLI